MALALAPAPTMAYMAGHALPALQSKVQMTAITPGDIGTTKPLGVYDPLNLMTSMPDKYRRWQEMEIKHGRIAMAATVHVLVTEVPPPARGEWAESILQVVTRPSRGL